MSLTKSVAVVLCVLCWYPSACAAGVEAGFSDIFSVYGELSEGVAVLSKAEFETTEQFNARKKEYLSSRARLVERAFKFHVSLEKLSNYFHYDAESSLVTLCLPFEDADQYKLYGECPGFYKANPYPNKIMVSSYTKEDQYLGSSPVAGPVKVKKLFNNNAAILAVNASGFLRTGKKPSALSGCKGVSFSFVMPPEEARAIKNKFGIYIVVSPSFVPCKEGVFTLKNAWRMEPTIDNPVDFNVSYVAITARVDEIVFYNMDTGVVLHSVKPQGIIQAPVKSKSKAK